jgi:hypothetical protein
LLIASARAGRLIIDPAARAASSSPSTTTCQPLARQGPSTCARRPAGVELVPACAVFCPVLASAPRRQPEPPIRRRRPARRTRRSLRRGGHQPALRQEVVHHRGERRG